MGTWKFLNNTHQRSLKCKLKKYTLGVHSYPTNSIWIFVYIGFWRPFWKKVPSQESSQDTACLPQIFLFPMKNWSRKTTWEFLLLRVAPPSILTRTIFIYIYIFQEPSFIFTEEYQSDFMMEYFKVFDTLRQEFLVGEMVWNFADFMTQQRKWCLHCKYI